MEWSEDDLKGYIWAELNQARARQLKKRKLALDKLERSSSLLARALALHCPEKARAENVSEALKLIEEVVEEWS